MLTRERLLAGFTGPIRPHRPSLLYRTGILLVCLTMILLPLIYLGIIAAAGWAVWWHATENTGILTGTGRRGFWTLLLYLTPIAVGAVLILFMVKPLFAPRAKTPPAVSLTPAGEPLVFELVRKLCEVVGAPMPRRIDVDHQVNASASFRRGFLSFFGHDLLLTIGLPLVAGLSLRNLVGVLAHEFGHFAQGSGMRATYVIRTVNAWFARVVYERDAWDERLVAWSAIDIRLSVVVWTIRFFVWLTRRVLWALMLAGHAVSMFMLRQMEYDADRYEVQVAGTASFARTARLLPVLNLAHGAALEALREAWNERRLGDNLPRMVVAEHARIPAEAQEKFLAEHLKGKGGVFDTHPPDQARIASACAKAVDGLFTLDAPGAEIFRDFDGLSRRVTIAFYRQVLGDAFTEKNLVRTEALIEQASASQEDVEALNRMFQDAVLPSALVFLGDEALAPAEDVGAAAAELAAARDDVRRRAAESKPAVSSLRKAEERLQQLDQLTAVARAGLRFKPADFDLKGAGAEQILAARRPVAAGRDSLRQHLAPVMQGLARRLTLAARLAQAPGGPVKGTAAEDLPKLLETQRVLRDVFPAARALLDDFASAGLLLGSLQENQGHEGLIGQLQAGSERWRKGLAELWPALARAPYPFEHAQGQASLADFLIGRLPADGAFGDILEALQSLGQKYYALYLRVLGRLCRLSEQVEALIGSKT